MLIIIFIMIIGSVIIFEYHSHCNLLPYRFFKLNDDLLNELGFYCISKTKTKLSVVAVYQYENVLLQVNRQRFTPLNVIGSAEIYQKKKRICNYSQLPKSFKTALYVEYIQLRYPKTFAKLIRYQSGNQKTRYLDFCKKEHLLVYTK